MFRSYLVDAPHLQHRNKRTEEISSIDGALDSGVHVVKAT